MNMKDEYKLMTPAKEQEIKALIEDRDTGGVTDYEVLNIPRLRSRLRMPSSLRG